MYVCVADEDSSQHVSDFNWDEYLEENGTVSVPHHAFKHVSTETIYTPNNHTQYSYNVDQ